MAKVWTCNHNLKGDCCTFLTREVGNSWSLTCSLCAVSVRLPSLGILTDLWNYIQRVMFPNPAISVELYYQDWLFICLSCCAYLQPLRLNYSRTRRRHIKRWLPQQQWLKAERVGNGWDHQLEERSKNFLSCVEFLCHRIVDCYGWKLP